MTNWKQPVVHAHDLDLHLPQSREGREVGSWHLCIRLRLGLPEGEKLQVL